MGRPPKSNELPLEKIIEIMLKSAKRGSFFQQLPYEIWSETGISVSLSYLEKIDDPTFYGPKSVAFAMCSKYWTELMAQAAIPSAAFIFIMKNVAKWTDNKNIVVADADIEKKSEVSQEERKARIELIKKMARESSK